MAQPVPFYAVLPITQPRSAQVTMEVFVTDDPVEAGRMAIQLTAANDTQYVILGPSKYTDKIADWNPVLINTIVKDFV